MPIRLVPRPPGQHKLARYRHTQSCIRITGCAPGKERDAQRLRRRVLAVFAVLLWLVGIAAVLS